MLQHQKKKKLGVELSHLYVGEKIYVYRSAEAEERRVRSHSMKLLEERDEAGLSARGLSSSWLL